MTNISFIYIINLLDFHFPYLCFLNKVCLFLLKMKNKKLRIFLLLITVLLFAVSLFFTHATKANTFRLTKPISVYITWGAHDNLSDTIPLSEHLVCKQLKVIHNLKKAGAPFNYFVLDAGWADTMSSCRKFDKQYWPKGHKKWISACRKEKLLPGLWFPINLTGLGKTTWMKMESSWKNSKTNEQTLSLSEGDFLNYHIQTFQYWYNQGIRLFKLDFAMFNVVTPRQKNKETTEIIKQNEDALFDALYTFKQKNKDAIFLAYNGFGGEMKDTYPHFKKTIQTKWLRVFESLYAGDPRPSDIPCSNFWRSKDIYSDHMVRQFQFNGIPLNRIDNCSFMIGNTGTCYQRKKANWKSTLLLSLARGGWVNTYYGDLSLLNAKEINWFSTAQTFWMHVQKNATFHTLGNIPGTGKVYGYSAENRYGKVYTLVNPSQTSKKFYLPVLEKQVYKVLYQEENYPTKIHRNTIFLKPEQMLILGTGKYATKTYVLSENAKKTILGKSRRVFTKQSTKLCNQMFFDFTPKSSKKLKLIFLLKDSKDRPIRISGGSPPYGKYLSDILQLNVTQNKHPLNLQTNNHKQIWSGMSWVVGEIMQNSYSTHSPIKILFRVDKNYPIQAKITCEIYEIG